MPDASDIYQDFLDRSSQAVWEKRWDDLADCMVYPHFICTQSRETVVAERSALIVFAQDFRKSLDTLGATAYYRICRGATLVGEAQDAIDGWHETFVLRGATMLMPPFSGAMTLRRTGSHWYGAGIRSDVRNADLRVNAAPLPHTGASAPHRQPGPGGHKTEDNT